MVSPAQAMYTPMRKEPNANRLRASRTFFHRTWFMAPVKQRVIERMARGVRNKPMKMSVTRGRGMSLSH
jgi:hypothetical protein